MRWQCELQIPLPPPRPTPAPVDDDATLPGGSAGVPTQKFQSRISRHPKLTPRHTHQRRCQLPPANPNAPPPPRRPLMLCAEPRRAGPHGVRWVRAATRARDIHVGCSSVKQTAAVGRSTRGLSGRDRGSGFERNAGGGQRGSSRGACCGGGCDLRLRQGVSIEYRVARAARHCRALRVDAVRQLRSRPPSTPSRLPPAPWLLPAEWGRSTRISPRRRRQSGRGARSRLPIGTSPPIRRRPSAAPGTPRRHPPAP